MKFVSIDASTKDMAFAYFVDEQPIKYGKLEFGGSDIYGKVMDISVKVKAFYHRFDEVEHMIIEAPVYINSPQTAQHLSMTHGAIVGAASLSGIRYVRNVVPMTWQNQIGNPKLTKEEKEKLRKKAPNKSPSWYKNQERQIRKNKTIHIVNDKYGLSVKDNDVADAIGIGLWATERWDLVCKK